VHAQTYITSSFICSLLLGWSGNGECRLTFLEEFQIADNTRWLLEKAKESSIPLAFFIKLFYFVGIGKGREGSLEDRCTSMRFNLVVRRVDVDFTWSKKEGGWGL